MNGIQEGEMFLLYSYFIFATNEIQWIPLYGATLGPVKTGSNNRLSLLPEVIYIILQIRTTKGGGSIKRCGLLAGELLTEAYCINIALFQAYGNILYNIISRCSKRHYKKVYLL